MDASAKNRLTANAERTLSGKTQQYIAQHLDNKCQAKITM